MVVNVEDKDFRHPEGKIQLLDGRVLNCYLADESGDVVDNKLKLDTTGVYLSLKKPSGKTVNDGSYSQDAKVTSTVKEREEQRKLFLDNAFVFLDNCERIFSDSRMFLCPVPVQSGIAYTGTSGFHRPTLGVYLEWWQRCEQASLFDRNGGEWLVYQIAGSPLSGSNHCGIVNPKGDTKLESIYPFISLWSSFTKINCRYDEPKALYQAYTLRQVLAILQGEGLHVNDYGKAKHINFLEQVNSGLRKQLDRLHMELNQTYRKLRIEKLKSKESELREFVAEYSRRKEVVDKRLAEIKEQRLTLRKRLKSGEIDNIQYQRLWTPLRREKDNMCFDLRLFEEETLHKLIPDMTFSYWEVEDFLNEQDNEGNAQGNKNPVR